MAESWQNRIVGYSEEPPDKLVANPANWRIHGQAQQDALDGVLTEVGLVQNIICNRTTGNIVDGHLRVAMALKSGQPMVPVTWVELDEAEEALILASLDPIAAMAASDRNQLEALLQDVQSGEPGVRAIAGHIRQQVLTPNLIQLNSTTETSV